MMKYDMQHETPWCQLRLIQRTWLNSCSWGHTPAVALSVVETTGVGVGWNDKKTSIDNTAWQTININNQLWFKTTRHDDIVAACILTLCLNGQCGGRTPAVALSVVETARAGVGWNDKKTSKARRHLEVAQYCCYTGRALVSNLKMSLSPENLRSMYALHCPHYSWITGLAECW